MPSAFKKSMDQDVKLSLSECVDLYGDYLYRYALVRLRHQQRAEDILQETFIAAHKAQDKFLAKASAKTWLFTILRNKITDYYRQKSKETSFTDLESLQQETQNHFSGIHEWLPTDRPNEWDPSLETHVERTEFWSVLNDCIEKLPNRMGDVFLMRELDGLESQEICETLNIKPCNLWTMMHRARMALRSCLGKNWFVERGLIE
jgi:RNA polymerase sigma-70 factor (TIGR02943 family)